MSDIYYNNPELRKSFANIGGQADQATNTYLQRATSFDPNAAVREAAMGAFNANRKKLGRDVSALRGQQVGMGRLDTGFATTDEDRTITDSADNLNNGILQNSVNATGMALANNNALGQFGQNAGNEYRGGIADLSATKAAQDAADKASKRSMWGNIIGGTIGAAGTILGGPIGGALLGGGAKKLAGAH